MNYIMYSHACIYTCTHVHVHVYISPSPFGTDFAQFRVYRTVGYYRGYNFREKPIMSLRSNFHWAYKTYIFYGTAVSSGLPKNMCISVVAHVQYTSF